jgi:hypothetical protein
MWHRDPEKRLQVRVLGQKHMDVCDEILKSSEPMSRVFLYECMFMILLCDTLLYLSSAVGRTKILALTVLSLPLEELCIKVFR